MRERTKLRSQSPGFCLQWQRREDRQKGGIYTMQSCGEGDVVLPAPAAFPSFLLHPVLMPPSANHSLCSWAASFQHRNFFMAQKWERKEQPVTNQGQTSAGQQKSLRCLQIHQCKCGLQNVWRQNQTLLHQTGFWRRKWTFVGKGMQITK